MSERAPAAAPLVEVAAAGDADEIVVLVLLDAQAGDGPGDHQLLDLLGAFEDVVDLGG